MKTLFVCFSIVFLCTAIGTAQSKREKPEKKTAVATYVSSMNGLHGGEITLRLRGKLVTFVWDRGTHSAPIFQSDPRGFQPGAEWRIVYLNPGSIGDGNYPYLVSATFTGRILSATPQAQTVRRADSSSVDPNTFYTYLLLAVTNGGVDHERRELIDSKIPAEIVDQAVQFIKKRLRLLKVSIFSVEREYPGSTRIVVKLPALYDPEGVKSTIVSSGRFELVHIINSPSPAPVQNYPTLDEAFQTFEGTLPAGLRVLPYFERSASTDRITTWVVGEVTAILETKDLATCNAVEAHGEPLFSVRCSLTQSGDNKLNEWSKSNINEYVGTVLNGEVFSIAYIASPIRGWIHFSGKFTKESVDRLIIELLSGGLPRTYFLQYEEERRINERNITATISPEPPRNRVIGYIDVIDVLGAGCRLRIITEDRVYEGIIGLTDLTKLAGQSIATLRDAIKLLSGKKLLLELSRLDYSAAASGNVTFGQYGGMALQPDNEANPTNPPWNEQTTSSETVIDLSADILFEFKKSDINLNAVPTLIRLARVIRNSGNGRVLLSGFTDSIGGDEYNLDLSERRAAAVKEWLVSKGGIDPDVLQTYGLGKARPVAPNTNADGTDNPAGRKKNRRVEIRIPRN